MSASPAPALDAIGPQLVAALESYEAGVARMLESWPDLEVYRGVSTQVEQIRLYASSLPQVRLQWMELLIAHADLIHMLWRIQHANRSAALAQIDNMRERHGACAAALRQRCERMIAHSRERGSEPGRRPG